MPCRWRLGLTGTEGKGGEKRGDRHTKRGYNRVETRRHWPAFVILWRERDTRVVICPFGIDKTPTNRSRSEPVLGGATTDHDIAHEADPQVFVVRPGSALRPDHTHTILITESK